MNPTTASLTSTADDADHRSREERQREAAREALANAYEHGAPETGPGEDLQIDNVEPDITSPAK